MNLNRELRKKNDKEEGRKIKIMTNEIVRGCVDLHDSNILLHISQKAITELVACVIKI